MAVPGSSLTEAEGEDDFAIGQVTEDFAGVPFAGRGEAVGCREVLCHGGLWRKGVETGCRGDRDMGVLRRAVGASLAGWVLDAEGFPGRVRRVARRWRR